MMYEFWYDNVEEKLVIITQSKSMKENNQILFNVNFRMIISFSYCTTGSYDKTLAGLLEKTYISRFFVSKLPTSAGSFGKVCYEKQWALFHCL